MNREGFCKKTTFRILATAFSLIAGIFGLTVSSFAQTENVLYSFTGATDGGFPLSSLLLDNGGNLYGTSSQGGYLSGCALRGCGVVYRLSPNSSGWTETVLYTFTGGIDGAAPVAGLIADHSGNLYGTAAVGGDLSCNPPNGCGVVFELSPAASGWKQTVLYTFRGGGDGNGPSAPLVFDSAGNLYGTAVIGGNKTKCFLNGCGVVFKLSPSSAGWKRKVLHAFSGGRDGAYPQADLILDLAGNLYGTTANGGNKLTTCGGVFPGCGVAFELSPNSIGGWKETVLHTFSGGRDGAIPLAGLIFDKTRNLYGTTEAGGGSANCQGCGVVFRLSPASNGWKENVLHTFSCCKGGGMPHGGLILDTAGNLYGTAIELGDLMSCPGSSGCGVVFKLSPLSGGGWKKTVLHAFHKSDGAGPAASVILDSAGNLYGTTAAGGNVSDCFRAGCGVVFQIGP